MCPVGVTRGKQARREAPTDGLASGCQSRKLVVGDAVARFWQSVVDTQARRAAELSGDHGVFRQRLRWIEPAKPNSWATRLTAVRFLRPISRKRDVAVGIALLHVDKDLAVLKQFEPPVGPGSPLQKSEAYPARKVRTASCYKAQVTPLRRSSGGAITAIIDWLITPFLSWHLCADHQVAPSSIRRSVTTVRWRLVCQNGPK